MTDSPAGPHARFPWMQLVFCLACLAMAAWTWMRYSYAWDVTGRSVLCSLRGLDLSRPQIIPFNRVYVRFCGLDAEKTWVLPDEETYPDGEWSPTALWTDPVSSKNTMALFIDIGVLTDSRLPPRWRQSRTRTSFYGRLYGCYYPGSSSASAHDDLQPAVPLYEFDKNLRLTIDTSASRFHPASIGGLVVGAMGVFVFGLHLRAWLRERKALASGPQRDIIA